MLTRLVSSPLAHFRHQTRDEVPLTDAQKLDIASDVYRRKPGIFLERFHSFLNWPEDRRNFLHLIEEDEVVAYFAEKLDRENRNSVGPFNVRQATSRTCRARNRRFKALQLMEQGLHPSGSHLASDYFSHEAMRHREPILWEEMVGQHLSAETRRLYLGQEYGTFSGFLLSQLQENRNNEELAAACALMTGDQTHPASRRPGYLDAITDKSDNDEEGQNLPALEQQFKEIMKLRFISCQDSNFDYSEIDNDESLDDDEQRAHDAEEAYFDED